MRDPDMVFEIHAWVDAAAAEPLSFRNDYMGLLQEVYRYDDHGRKTHVNARLKQELTSFARTWFTNLKHQGFLGETATRERLYEPFIRDEVSFAAAAEADGTRFV